MLYDCLSYNLFTYTMLSLSYEVVIFWMSSGYFLIIFLNCMLFLCIYCGLALYHVSWWRYRIPLSWLMVATLMLPKIKTARLLEFNIIQSIQWFLSCTENFVCYLYSYLTGCFPTLATIPVWIGLYQALSNVANEVSYIKLIVPFEST